MNFPLSISADEPNNAWMLDGAVYDKILACEQWLKLYRRLAREALVYVLPGHSNLQDLPFVANIGCYLPHRPGTMLLSRFTSRPRHGEEAIGLDFFSSFHYDVRRPPACWEGEADLKWIKDNIYIGAIGQRSTPKAYMWMQKALGMEVIEIALHDPKLYHLDCVFMKLPGNRALVNLHALSNADIDKLAKVVDIVEVPSYHRYSGWTNGLMLGSRMLHSAISTAEQLAETLPDLHLECFDLTEFEKSGADLSCLVMHLNHAGRL